MGSEIFDQNITDNTGATYSPLTITTLSKYKYSDDSISLLPPSVVAGYGTLYERMSISDKLQVDCKNLREITKYDIRNNTASGDDSSCESDIAETGTYDQLSTLMDTIYGVGVEPGSSAAPRWALAKEFTNNNQFSQPILHLNDELRHCVYGVSGMGGAYTECSGSLESWRNYNSEDQIPLYQTIDLYTMTPLLK